VRAPQIGPAQQPWTFAHAMTALGHPRLRRSNYNTVHVRFAPKSEQTVIIEIGPGLA
jgi:hypothetical protein